VTFVVFSAAVIAWSLAVLRWAFSIRRGRGRRLLQTLSCVVIVVAAISIASDLRARRIVWNARSSDLEVRIVRRDAWWQLDYSNRGVSFTTANELHVPAGAALRLAWLGVNAPWTGDALCLPRDDGRCVFVAATPAVRTMRFISLRPPAWRTLRIVVESPDRFARWFANEARPASNAFATQGATFRNAGCAYCHVIRGVANEPWRAAPDLTHFASRSTIGGSNLPNRRAELTGWIVHSTTLVPGSGMPDNALAPDVLRAIVALLESLR